MTLPTIPLDDWRWALTHINGGPNEICVLKGEIGARGGFDGALTSRVNLDKRDWESLEYCVAFISDACNATFIEDKPKGPRDARLPAHYFRILVSVCAT